MAECGGSDDERSSAGVVTAPTARETTGFALAPGAGLSRSSSAYEMMDRPLSALRQSSDSARSGRSAKTEP